MLARKYRPKNFSEMVGQSHVVQALGNALRTQRLHHAYLFTGTRGVGKTTISRILAKSLNCVGPDGQGGITPTPCGVCQACTDIDSGRFVDYTELDAASNRGIDDVLLLLEQAVYKPVQGRFKVFMIDEVHMLTGPAFNAMLKTLEEPPEYLKFVLATTDPQKVPATVLSRCLQFSLRPMAPETMLQHLGHVLQIENVPAEQQALRLLARAARGSMRDALSLTDQAIAFGSGQLLEAGVRLMLGSVDRSYVFRLLDALARGDGKVVVETSEELRLHGLSAASTLEEMTTLLQRMAVLQAVPEMMATSAGSGDDNADPEASEIARLAQTMPADETQLLYSLCLHGRGELGLAPDEYAALTMVLLRLLAFKPAQAGASVVPSAQVGNAAGPSKKPLADAGVISVAVRAQAAAVPAIPVPAKLSENNAVSVEKSPVDHSGRAQPAISLVAPDVVTAAGEGAVAATTATQVSAVPSDVGRSAPAVGSHRICLAPPAIDAAPSGREQNHESSPHGDHWSELVGQLVVAEAIGAMVRELALQSELRSRESGVWTLRVERQSLNQTAACDKLLLAVQSLLGAAADSPCIKLVIEVGLITDSPARRAAAAQLERQRQAEEIIRNDGFVRDMVRDWGAKIGPVSVRPRLQLKPAGPAVAAVGPI